MKEPRELMLQELHKLRRLTRVSIQGSYLASHFYYHLYSTNFTRSIQAKLASGKTASHSVSHQVGERNHHKPHEAASTMRRDLWTLLNVDIFVDDTIFSGSSSIST